MGILKQYWSKIGNQELQRFLHSNWTMSSESSVLEFYHWKISDYAKVNSGSSTTATLA